MEGAEVQIVDVTEINSDFIISKLGLQLNKIKRFQKQFLSLDWSLLLNKYWITLLFIVIIILLLGVFTNEILSRVENPFETSFLIRVSRENMRRMRLIWMDSMKEMITESWLW